MTKSYRSSSHHVQISVVVFPLRPFQGSPTQTHSQIIMLNIRVLLGQAYAEVVCASHLWALKKALAERKERYMRAFPGKSLLYAATIRH